MPSNSSHQEIGKLLLVAFRRAGIPPDGSQSLALHSDVFTQVFLGSSHGTSLGPDPTGGNEDCDSPLVSRAQYFELLCTDGLGWLTFFDNSVPALPASVMAVVLTALVDFVDGTRDRGMHGRTDDRGMDVQLVKLLTSGLTLVQNFILNLLPPTQKGESDCKDQEEHISQRKTLRVDLEHFQTDVTTIGSETWKCLHRLLRLFSSREVFPLLDSDTVCRMVSVLLFMCNLVDPVLSLESTVGKVIEWQQKTVVSSTASATSAERSETKQKSLPASISHDESFDMTTINISPAKEQRVDLSTGLGSAMEDPAVETVDGENDKASRKNLVSSNLQQIEANVDLQSKTEKILLLAIDTIKSSVSPKCFCQVVRFLICGPSCAAEGRHQVETDGVYHSEMMKCSERHRFNQEFLLDVLTRVFRFTQSSHLGADVCSQYRELEEDLGPITCAFLPQEFSAAKMRSRKETEVDLVIESGRSLGQPGDLDLVRKALEQKMKGWMELMAVGLLSTDVGGWWEAGFYDLMWESEAALSTEKNVARVLQVLRAATDSRESGAQIVTKLEKLFQVMFRRLPTAVQERVVRDAIRRDDLASCTAPTEKSTVVGELTVGMSQRLSRAGVVNDLTSLLNRLTLANADETLPSVLVLCLRDLDAVLRHLLSRAVESNGQVPAVVHVLRGMWAICATVRPPSRQSRLHQALREVLTDREVSPDKWRNLQQLVFALTKPFSQVQKSRSCVSVRAEPRVLVPLCAVVCDILRPLMGTWVCGEQDGGERDGGEQDGGEQDGGEQDGGEQDGGDTAGGETLSVGQNTSMSVNSGQMSKQFLSQTLSVVNSLLSHVNPDVVMQLEPVSLCAVTCDIYVLNYDVTAGGEVDKETLQVKAAARKCLDLLIGAVTSHGHSQGADGHLQWLCRRVCSCSWLHLAVLLPLLPAPARHPVDVKIAAMADRMVMDINKGLQELCLLVQMATCCNQTLRHIIPTFSRLAGSVGKVQLVTLLCQILFTSLAPEMTRLVEIVLRLVPKDSGTVPDPGARCEEQGEQTPGWEGVERRRETSVLLTQAALACLLAEVSETSRCHVLSNYQAALKALVPSTNDLTSLPLTALQHCLLLLSEVGGQAALILQVCALDLLSMVQDLSSGKKRGGHGGKLLEGEEGKGGEGEERGKGGEGEERGKRGEHGEEGKRGEGEERGKGGEGEERGKGGEHGEERKGGEGEGKLWEEGTGKEEGDGGALQRQMCDIRKSVRLVREESVRSSLMKKLR